ncbi:MAG: glycoside hydrolase, partial [Gemmataceae bacterium]|nr:glycoside hydrolase [Gemmataceae bacterium]
MSFPWWSHLFRRLRVRPSPSRSRTPWLRARTLGLEALEDRTLLAVVFSPGTLTTPTNRPDIAPGILAAVPFPGPLEPTVAVSPADPGKLIVSSQTHQRVTTNAGQTFTSSVTSFAARVASAGNSSTLFDPQGRLFWANLDQLDAITTGITLDQVDPVTGALLGSPKAVSTPPAGQKDDMVSLATDANSNLYAVWPRFDTANNPSILIARSTDQGTTWSTPVTVSDAGEGFVWPATVSVAASGDVYVAYHATPGYPDGTTGKTYVARYTNNLSTRLSKNLAFAAGASDVTFNVQTAPRTLPQTTFWTQGSARPYVLADPTRAGYVYVIAADDPGNGSGTGDRASVVLARSTNYGASWTTSTLEAGPSNSMQLFPT